MKKYLWMSSAADVIGALRVKFELDTYGSRLFMYMEILGMLMSILTEFEVVILYSQNAEKIRVHLLNKIAICLEIAEIWQY